MTSGISQKTEKRRKHGGFRERRAFYLTIIPIYFIIQARKLACKGFRARYFNGNGGLSKTKRMATTVADKILFCPVLML